MPFHILLVDEAASIRSRVHQLLTGDLPDAVVEQVDPADALARVEGTTWTFVIMDIRVSSGGGLALLRRLREANPANPIVILSSLPVEPYALEAAKLGACAYVHKERAAEDLLPTLRTLARSPA